MREEPPSKEFVDELTHKDEPQVDNPVADLMGRPHGQSSNTSHPGQSTSDYIEPPPAYNVLVLGETQSGKSTLIQYMKKYADSTKAIDSSAIGNSIHSHTMDVISTPITTDLPEYHVIKECGSKFNYGEHMMGEDACDYEESLECNNLRLEKGNSRLGKKVRFNLIDTPGLNTSEGDDETHILKIFDALIEAKTIHLLLITISCRPPNQEFKDVIQAYADMFHGFKGIIAFVHTSFCYKNLHPTRNQACQAVVLRMQSLHEIMGRESFPHFKIDCHVHKQATRDCITRNTIQNILELARLNHPVDMLHTTINKTPRMKTIDSILQDKVVAMYECMLKTLRFKDGEQADLLKAIYGRETEVHKLEAQIKALDEYLSHHDVELLELLHEDRREMEYAKGGEGAKVSIRYPKDGKSEFPIARANYHCQGVKVLSKDKEMNGKGPRTSWKANVERTSSDHSVLHVRIYSTKAHVYQAEIQKKSQKRAALRGQLQAALQHRGDHIRDNESNEKSIKQLVDNLNEVIQVLRQVHHQSLSPDTFKDLLGARAFDGDIDACAKKVQKVYIAQEAKLRPEVSPQRHDASPQGQAASHQVQEADPERQEPSLERQEPSPEGQEPSPHGNEVSSQGPEVISFEVKPGPEGAVIMVQ
ncbi:hypothetical protein BGZ74_003170 [Mortierella antarctica]|nr:hypothetical protein BGZ74_003170 [Mortierella antarctica]